MDGRLPPPPFESLSRAIETREHRPPSFYPPIQTMHSSSLIARSFNKLKLSAGRDSYGPSLPLSYTQPAYRPVSYLPLPPAGGHYSTVPMPYSPMEAPENSPMFARMGPISPLPGPIRVPSLPEMQLPIKKESSGWRCEWEDESGMCGKASLSLPDRQPILDH
jgi:hypothetical protein